MKLKIFALVGLMSAAGMILATSQTSNAAEGDLDVVGRVAPTLRITPQTALDFGSVINADSTNPGFIHVAPNAAQSVTNVTQLGTANQGTFDLRARTSSVVNLSFEPSIVLTCAVDTDPTGDCIGGTNAVTIDQFSHSFGGTMPATPGLPTVTVNFGGRMSVAANQNSGVYAGTVVLTATY